MASRALADKRARSDSGLLRIQTVQRYRLVEPEWFTMNDPPSCPLSSYSRSVSTTTLRDPLVQRRSPGGFLGAIPAPPTGP